MSKVTSVTDNDAGPNEAFSQALKKIRIAKKLSLGELARKADMSKSNLSRLEAGNGNPSLETLWSLSEALGVGVRELIDQNQNNVRFQPHGESIFSSAEASDFNVALLASCPIGSTRDLYRATFEPGDPKISAAHGPGVIEHVILVDGKARIGPIKTPALLSRGDYLTFSGAQEHIYDALEEGTVAIIVMEYS